MPNRAWSATQPSTQPGTVTVRMSCRNGITVWPSARSASASAPEPARPLALSATTPVGRRHEREQVAAHARTGAGRRRPSRRWWRSPRRRRCRRRRGCGCRRWWRPDRRWRRHHGCRGRRWWAGRPWPHSTCAAYDRHRDRPSTDRVRSCSRSAPRSRSSAPSCRGCSSGSTERSSYEVFGLVERLGFSPNSAIGWALRLWPLVPLALVLTVIAHWAHHPSLRWPRHTVTSATLLYPGVTAVAVANAPQIATVRRGPRAVGDAGRRRDHARRSGDAVRRSVPLPALDQQLLQHLRPIGHDPVDAEVEQALHLGAVVDRPDVHLMPPAWPARRTAPVTHGEPADPRRAPGRRSDRPADRAPPGTQAVIWAGPKLVQSAVAEAPRSLRSRRSLKLPRQTRSRQSSR